MTTNRKPVTRTGSPEHAAKLFDVDSKPRDDIPAQIRRRRAASYRCPPMVDSRRDPLSTKRPACPGSRTLHVEVGRHTAWLHGDRIVRLLERAGVQRRQWDWQRRLWMIPVQYADDVMAYAEWKQRRLVSCEAIER